MSGAGWLLRSKSTIDRELGRRVPRLAAVIDRRRPERWARWGPALNGQEGRRQLMKSLVDALEPVAFVETGLYRGMTTEFVRRELGLEVYGAELDPRYFAFCRWRFRHDAGVHLTHGDSRHVLRGLAAGDQLPPGLVLFYLDAHWNDDLPLAEEVDIIASAWPERVIVVDDFEVPGDPGYVFDGYGPGKEMRLADIPLERPGTALFFPSLPSSAETGMRSGCVVVAPEGHIAESLAGLALLRRHQP